MPARISIADHRAYLWHCRPKTTPLGCSGRPRPDWGCFSLLLLLERSMPQPVHLCVFIDTNTGLVRGMWAHMLSEGPYMGVPHAACRFKKKEVTCPCRLFPPPPMSHVELKERPMLLVTIFLARLAHVTNPCVACRFKKMDMSPC